MAFPNLRLLSSLGNRSCLWVEVWKMLDFNQKRSSIRCKKSVFNTKLRKINLPAASVALNPYDNQKFGLWMENGFWRSCRGYFTACICLFTPFVSETIFSLSEVSPRVEHLHIDKAFLIAHHSFIFWLRIWFARLPLSRVIGLLQFSLWVQTRRFSNRLSLLFPLMWSISIPSGTGPANVS